MPIIDQMILQSFIDNKVNLQEKDTRTYRSQVNRLREQLEDHIRENPEFILKKMLLSGSLAKGSALSTLNDIDVAVYMTAGEDATKQQVVDWLRDRLVEAYPNLNRDQITPFDHAVRIEFHGTGLDVECVPVISTGKDDWGYVFSRDTGEKTLANIPLQLEFLRKRKGKQPKDFIQVIRLIKWWVHQQKDADPNFHFKSMMVELICCKLLDQGTEFDDIALAVESFFEFILVNQFQARIYFEDYYKKSELPTTTTGPIEVFDPVNPTNNVASQYTESDRQKIIAASQAAYDAITWARRIPTKAEAVPQWQIVLGNTFRG